MSFRIIYFEGWIADDPRPPEQICQSGNCFDRKIKGGRLCAEHELLFIAQFGFPSAHCKELDHPEMIWEDRAYG